MFCNNCGAQIPNGNGFCTRCGAPVPAVRAYRPAPAAPEPITVEDIRVRAAVKRVGASPVFLIAVICFTLVQLLEILTIGANADISALYGLLSQLGMSSRDIADMLSGISTASGVLQVIGMIPSLLILAGLWMIFGSAASRSDRMGTAGLTMIQVVKILELVFLGLALVILDMIVIFGVVLAGSYTDETARVVMLTCLMLLLGITALVFVYYILMLTSMSKVKSTLNTGIPNRRVSCFVAVICFIGGLFSLYSGAKTLPYFSLMSATGMLSNISTLLSGVMTILFGVMIFVYRSVIGRLEREISYETAPAGLDAGPEL